MSISICVIYVTEFAMRKLKLELNTKLCQYDTLKNTENDNKKNYNMILSCYNYGRVTIIYDAIVNY